MGLKDYTSAEKWSMTINIGGQETEVLFDGLHVYDPIFPTLEIQQLSCPSGRVITQETLRTVCRHKMSVMKLVKDSDSGKWQAVEKDCCPVR